MNGPDSHQFRRITLAEYKSRQDDIDNRLTLDDLRSGFTIAEGYMTNTSLAHRDGALTFTTTVELLSPIEAHTVGAVGIKLVILHANPKSDDDNAVERFADAYPHGGDSSAPLWWAISGQFGIRLPSYSKRKNPSYLFSGNCKRKI